MLPRIGREVTGHTVARGMRDGTLQITTFVLRNGRAFDSGNLIVRADQLCDKASARPVQTCNEDIAMI